jgi:hypothetical protein
MLDLGDPISAAMGHYLAAAMGDMAGRDDLLSDITAARELATFTGDVSLLSQLLRLEASALERSQDARGRALLADAAEQLEAVGGIRAAALARRDLGLLALESGDHAEAARQLSQAAIVLVRLDRSAAAPAVAGIARLAVEQGDADTGARIAAAVPSLRRRDAPSSADDERRADALLAGIEAGFGTVSDSPLADDQLLELCAAVAIPAPTD